MRGFFVVRLNVMLIILDYKRRCLLVLFIEVVVYPLCDCVNEAMKNLWHGDMVLKQRYPRLYALEVKKTVDVASKLYLVKEEASGRQLLSPRFLGHYQPQVGKPALWELDSDQHQNVGSRGSNFLYNNTRGSYQRSLSDGNFTSSAIDIGQNEESEQRYPGESQANNNVLSESSPEISTCKKWVRPLWSKSSDWQPGLMGADLEWKEIAEPVMELYREATDGSTIETKDSGLVWHHQDADLVLVKLRSCWFI
ncbi:phosphoinositide phosphatase SAC2-like protein isoform X2 [Tanacetum coccineum]